MRRLSLFFSRFLELSCCKDTGIVASMHTTFVTPTFWRGLPTAMKRYWISRYLQNAFTSYRIPKCSKLYNGAKKTLLRGVTNITRLQSGLQLPAQYLCPREDFPTATVLLSLLTLVGMGGIGLLYGVCPWCLHTRYDDQWLAYYPTAATGSGFGIATAGAEHCISVRVV